MNKRVVENNELIATRVAPGDQWILVKDSKRVVHACLTDALQAYFESTGFKGSYRLDPFDSKLYAIQSNEVEIIEEAPKEYSFYGNFSQGI